MGHQDEAFLRKAAEAKARVKSIEASEVDKAAASGAVVIDVREPDEHAKDHVPGSLNISIGLLAERAAQAVPGKDTPIVCYCNGGNRGALGAVELENLGFTNVRSIAGGLRAYVALPDKKKPS